MIVCTTVSENEVFFVESASIPKLVFDNVICWFEKPYLCKKSTQINEFPREDAGLMDALSSIVCLVVPSVLKIQALRLKTLVFISYFVKRTLA